MPFALCRKVSLMFLLRDRVSHELEKYCAAVSCYEVASLRLQQAVWIAKTHSGPTVLFHTTYVEHRHAGKVDGTSPTLRP